MEMYLNTVYYGDLNYSAEAAAQDFFGLQPKCDHTKCKTAVGQLDLAQASMLAGLPQGPSLYNPIINKPAALARQKVVLQAYAHNGRHYCETDDPGGAGDGKIHVHVSFY